MGSQPLVFVLFVAVLITDFLKNFLLLVCALFYSKLNVSFIYEIYCA